MGSTYIHSPSRHALHMPLLHGGGLHTVHPCTLSTLSMPSTSAHPPHAASRAPRTPSTPSIHGLTLLLHESFSRGRRHARRGHPTNRETPPRSHPNVGNTCRGTAPLLCSTYRAVTLLERGCPCCLRAVHMGQHRHRPPLHARLPAGGVRVLRSMDRSIGRTNEAAGQASKRAALIEAAPHFEQGVRGGGFSSVGRALD